MKISVSFYLLIFYATFQIHAQSIEGAWSGIMNQEAGGTRADYFYSLTIRKEGKNVYSGTSYVQYLDKPEIFGVMELKAIYADGNFVFKESHIVQQQEDMGMYWCIKQGILAYSERGDSAYLSGKWESWNPTSCSPGTVVLRKALPKKQAVVNPISDEPEQKIEEKSETKPIVLPKKEETAIVSEMKKRTPKVIQTEPITVSERDFYIEIFDHGHIDGDTISLFFNDKPILVDFGLGKEHRRIDLKYDTALAQNKLLLHAHNLGTSPPNSAAILIFSGDKVQKVSLLSNLNESGLIQIKYKP